MDLRRCILLSFLKRLVINSVYLLADFYQCCEINWLGLSDAVYCVVLSNTEFIVFSCIVKGEFYLTVEFCTTVSFTGVVQWILSLVCVFRCFSMYTISVYFTVVWM